VRTHKEAAVVFVHGLWLSRPVGTAGVLLKNKLHDAGTELADDQKPSSRPITDPQVFAHNG